MEMRVDSVKPQIDDTPSFIPENIRITGSLFHIDRNESFYQVEYPALNGQLKVLTIRRDLFRTPTKVADLLMAADAKLAAPVEAVKAALLNKSIQHYELTGRTGWHGSSFVYPTETMGELSGQLFYDRARQINPTLGLSNGSPDGWREGLRDPCKFSDYLIFTLSVAAASTLLEIIGQDEGAIFHLHGIEANSRTKGKKTKSSSGKTLSARSGISVVGRCRKNDLASFAITERAVEDFCFSHNHLTVALDEEGRGSDGGSSSKIKSVQLPYLIASGRGTVRSIKAMQDQSLQNLSWALLALSTGENPLDGLSGSIPRSEGAQTRMIGIPVPAGHDGGIFNRSSGTPQEISTKCRELARQVEQTICENYGVAMPEYLRRLIPKKESLGPFVQRIIDKFVKRVGADTDPWERRFAEKFGLVLAGAILMSGYGIGPWTKKRARNAIAKIYKVARSTTISTHDATDKLLRRLRRLVKEGTRFPLIKKGASFDASDAWGVTKKLSNGKRAVFIPLSRLKKLVKPPVILSRVISELDNRGILISAADGKHTVQMMFKGSPKRRRYVCLNRESLI